MTIRSGTRSLAARLARLEQQVVEPQGPVVYRVYFHDGTPVWPQPDDGTATVSPAERPEIIYRIASWEAAATNATTARTASRGTGLTRRV